MARRAEFDGCEVFRRVRPAVKRSVSSGGPEFGPLRAHTDPRVRMLTSREFFGPGVTSLGAVRSRAVSLCFASQFGLTTRQRPMGPTNCCISVVPSRPTPGGSAREGQQGLGSNRSWCASGAMPCHDHGRGRARTKRPSTRLSTRRWAPEQGCFLCQ